MEYLITKVGHIGTLLKVYPGPFEYRGGHISVSFVRMLLLSALQYGKVTKLTSDAKFEESDIKASIAAISFILSSAAKYSVDGDELQQHQQLRAEGSNTLSP